MTTIKLPAQYWIEFTACTGFGTKGRTASIRTIEGDMVDLNAYGHGETDSEAVLEALVSMSLDFDAAFDMFSSVLRQATRVTCVYCERND